MPVACITQVRLCIGVWVRKPDPGSSQDQGNTLCLNWRYIRFLSVLRKVENIKEKAPIAPAKELACS